LVERHVRERRYSTVPARLHRSGIASRNRGYLYWMATLSPHEATFSTDGLSSRSDCNSGYSVGLGPRRNLASTASGLAFARSGEVGGSLADLDCMDYCNSCDRPPCSGANLHSSEYEPAQ